MRHFGRITDNVYYFSGFEDDVGAGFIVTDEGIVVVDTTMIPTSASTLLGIIRMLYPNKDVIAIINTHVHIDHHFGNEVFVKEFPDVEIIAHRKFAEYLKEWAKESGRSIERDLPERMLRRPDMKFLKPYLETLKVIPSSKIVYGDTTMEFGDTEIRIIHAPSHTEALFVVYLPQEKVLFASDTIYTPNRIPTLFMGDPDTWISTPK